MSFQFFTIGSALSHAVCQAWSAPFTRCSCIHSPGSPVISPTYLMVTCSEPQRCQTLDPGLSAGRALPRGTTADSGSLCTVED